METEQVDILWIPITIYLYNQIMYMPVAPRS